MPRYPRMPGGVIVPTRFSFSKVDQANSSYTEQGPRPGPAEPITAGASYRVQNTGQQGEDIEVRALRSGRAGSMGIGYRLPERGETTQNDYRGWNPPTWFDRHIPWGYSAALTYHEQDCDTLPDSQVVALIRKASNGNAHTLRYDPVSNGLLAGQVTLSAATHPHWQYPALCVMPDPTCTGGGRVLLLYGGIMYSSTDGGAAYQVHARHPLDGEDITDFERVRMRYRDGEILLIVEDGTGAIRQYASRDEGATFDFVSTSTMGDAVSIAATPEGFVVLMREDDDDYLAVVRLPTAYTPIDQALKVLVTNFPSLGRRHCIAAEPDGTLWVWFASQATPNGVTVIISRDDGRTWSNCQGRAWVSGTISTGFNIHRSSAAFSCGRLVLLHSWQNAASGRDGIGVSVFGGWSSLTALPPGEAGAITGWLYEDRIGSGGWRIDGGASHLVGECWIPVRLPENSGQGWSVAGHAGTLSGHALVLTPTSESVNYTAQQAAQLVGTPIDFMGEFSLGASTGSSSTNDVRIQIFVADNSAKTYTMTVRLWSAGIAAYDGISNALLGSASATLTDRFQVALIVSESGVGSVLYRMVGDTRWVVLAGNVALTNTSGTPLPNSSVQFGVTQSTGTMNVYSMSYRVQLNTTTYHPRFAWGGSSYGRILSGTPTPIPDAGAGGAVPWLRASGGVARLGDRLLLPVIYDHGLHKAFPEIEPSSAIPWKTAAGDTGEQIIRFDLGANSLEGLCIGFAMLDTNVPLAYLEDSANGTTWTTRAALDLRMGGDGLTGRLSASQDVLTPGNSTDEISRYLWAHELVGGTVALGEAGVVRRIIGQTPGTWGPGITATTRARIRIALEGSEPTGTDQPIEIRHHSGVTFYFHTALTYRRHWRIRIPAGTTVEGHWYVGTLIVGRVVPWGAEVDLARGDEWERTAVSTRDAYGVSRVWERGPGNRTWSVSWQEGQRHDVLRLQPHSLDWVGATRPLAAAEDVGEALLGVYRETRSGAIPVLAIEALPTTNGARITDPTRFLYGRLEGSVRTNMMAGNQWGADEYTRVEGITIVGIPGPWRSRQVD